MGRGSIARVPSPDIVLLNRFLSAYDRLDELIRDRLGRGRGDSHTALLNEIARSNAAVRSNLRLLKRLAELRNLVQHDAERTNLYPFAIPGAAVVERYEKIVASFLDEPLAIDRCVRRDKLYTAKTTDTIVEIMTTMAKRGFSQVPVIDGDQLVGVFSESTPFAVVTQEKELLIDGTLELNAVRAYLKLDRQINESFAFVGRTAKWSDVESLFSENRRQVRRLGAVFVTERGRASERLLGMITPWDLA